MRAGHNGRIAISWKQTELDGLEAAPLAFLAVGAAWSWRGQATVLNEVAVQNVEQASNDQSLRARTSESFAVVREFAGEFSGTVVLTNGAQQFLAELFVPIDDPMPTLVFDGGCPPRDQDFWISELSAVVTQAVEIHEPTANVVAFPGQRCTHGESC